MRTLLMLITLLAGIGTATGQWEQLPPLPDKEGFAGPFAGASHGALLVAGGANFPEKKPWEGGKKVWYDNVFVLDKPDGQWQVAGTLPRPLGYGVSVTYRNSVVCIGGSDAERHYADAFRLEWQGEELTTSKLPPLPRPIANACGALVNDTLYVAGGQETPETPQTLNTVYRIDLSALEPQWQTVATCPNGGRMLAVAAACDGAFWLAGGADLVVDDQGTVTRRYLHDAYRYDDANGWQRIADLPYPIVAAPSPAPADATGFYLLGGDDGSQVSLSPEHHRGFRKQIVRYDLKAKQWTTAGELSAARVTVPCVLWDNAWVIPSGEARPGIRSPEVWSSIRNNKD